MIAKLIISSEKQVILKEIEKILSGIGITNPHPDLYYFDSGQKLGIEQARKIKQFFSTKPYSALGKVVVLEDASKLTDEAQNSLLKTLEELTPNSLFILGAASDTSFLPTILSRCQIIKSNSTPGVKQVPTPGVEVEKLMQMDIAGRFEYIEKLKDKKKFLSELTAFFRARMISEKDAKNIHIMKEIIQAEEWAAQNVNIRTILEYLMLVIPIN